jgi:hypothetical protein
MLLELFVHINDFAIERQFVAVLRNATCGHLTGFKFRLSSQLMPG